MNARVSLAVNMDDATRWNLDRMDAMRREEENTTLYWDEKRREQLGVVNQALLGVALAAVVLVPQFLGNAAFLSNRLALVLVVLGIGLLAASLLFGVAVALIRLHDFREEAKLARDRQRGHISSEEAKARRARLRDIGAWTWRALYAQVGAASLGFFLLVLALLIGTWVAANAFPLPPMNATNATPSPIH